MVWRQAYKVVWEPLLMGKFSDRYKEILWPGCGPEFIPGNSSEGGKNIWDI